MPAADPGLRVDKVLVVCTANQCRSPLAAALLAHEVEQRHLRVAVRAAGIGPGGSRATPPTVKAASRLGIDLTNHVSTQVDPTQVQSADLIVGMERLHVRELVVMDRDAWPRVFTLKELVRRGQAVGRRRDDESLHTWLTRVNEGRRRLDLIGASPDDDVADPTNNYATDHDRTASDLQALIESLVDLAW